MTSETLVVLAAAVRSGYLRFGDAIAWADRQILIQDELPQWLLGLSLASTQDAAVTGLLSAWQNANSAIGEASLFDRLCLGFLFLRYARGELELTDLLKSAGHTADAGDCGVDCESFYSLLNKLGDGIPAKAIAEEARLLLAPFVNLATDSLGLLSEIQKPS